MTLDDIVDVPDHVMARRVSDESVLLDLESGRYYGLDAIGARVWELLGEKRTVQDVCRILAPEYDVPREQFEKDVLVLLESLLDAKLVRLAN
jgi:hypothetical protein